MPSQERCYNLRLMFVRRYPHQVVKLLEATA